MKKLAVKTSQSLSEKEAFALLQMVSHRGGGIAEPIRERIMEMISKGQSYGLVNAETTNKEKIDSVQAKSIAASINTTFKKSDVKFSVRYVPARDGFLFVPEEKMKEMFGKS